MNDDISALLGWFESHHISAPAMAEISLEVVAKALAQDARSVDELHRSIGITHDQLVCDAYRHFLAKKN
jgi:hypothetical protein